MIKRVFVTGMGVISPLGNSAESLWNGIKNGECGIDFITQFDTSDYKVKLAAEVKYFNPEEYMDRKEARRMHRFSQFAVAAAKQAVLNANLNLEDIDKHRLGVVVGSGIGGLSSIEQEHSNLLTKGPRKVSPFLIPMIIANMAAGNVAIQLGAKGICTSVVTACATGSNAIGDAFHLLQSGIADVIVAGGSESAITPLGIAGFEALTALSSSTDPHRASIPFDAKREGFVIGEGAGILILETEEHAKKRNAKVFAEIVGYGATCDAYHITSPSPGGEGGAEAMRQALREARIAPSEISYINAHGTSTPANDKLETLAIKSVFGEDSYKIPVSSTKSMTGHLLGAAGAVEAIICIKALNDGFIPPTIGLTQHDPECDLDYVPNKGRHGDITYAMSNSFGFGGHNAVLIFKKYAG